MIARHSQSGKSDNMRVDIKHTFSEGSYTSVCWIVDPPQVCWFEIGDWQTCWFEVWFESLTSDSARVASTVAGAEGAGGGPSSSGTSGRLLKIGSITSQIKIKIIQSEIITSQIQIMTSHYS